MHTAWRGEKVQVRRTHIGIIKPTRAMTMCVFDRIKWSKCHEIVITNWLKIFIYTAFSLFPSFCQSFMPACYTSSSLLAHWACVKNWWILFFFSMASGDCCTRLCFMSHRNTKFFMTSSLYTRWKLTNKKHITKTDYGSIEWNWFLAASTFFREWNWFSLHRKLNCPALHRDDDVRGARQ